MSYKATPMSRRQICRLIRYIKKQAGLENDLYFPILEFVENILPIMYKDYSFEIVPEQEMGNKHGETFPNSNIIRIREDIYERAAKGEGRDRMTVAHEVGHFFLHGKNSISFCRLAPGEKLKPFEDPEWQANAFGGELLASSYLIRNMNENEVIEKCGVTYEAASIQIEHCYDELLY
jgi:Zn-dependent peptidase ImmA (M78 family)